VDISHDLIHVQWCVESGNGEVGFRPSAVHPRMLKDGVLLEFLRAAAIIERNQVVDRDPAIQNLSSDKQVQRSTKSELP
jgi:hypothetical protein